MRKLRPTHLFLIYALTLLIFSCKCARKFECNYDGIDYFSLGDSESIEFEQPVYVIESVTVNHHIGTPILDFVISYRTHQNELLSRSTLVNVTSSLPNIFSVKQLRLESPYQPPDRRRRVKDDEENEDRLLLHYRVIQVKFSLILETQLDYFVNVDHRYTFTLKASSQSPFISRSATCIVQIGLKNHNLHVPSFVSSNTIQVSELAAIDSVIGAVQAIDLDGDSVNYSLLNHMNVFHIDSISGVIKLKVNLSLVKPTDVTPDDLTYTKYYDLIVEAKDDAHSCGSNTECSRLTNRTTVRILIIDVNKQAPMFISNVCGQSITIPEGRKESTPIISLSAEDKDQGPNGQIDFFFPESSSRNNAYSKFKLIKHSQLGHVRNVSLYATESFDYDAPHSVNTYFLLIFAQDSGRQPRQDFCFLKIQISDVNDNRPIFTVPELKYNRALPTDDRLRTLLRVIATDKDSGDNARIKYSLKSPNRFFGIEADTGFIVVKKTTRAELEKSNSTVTLEIIATDCGVPPLESKDPAKVIIDWVSVRENDRGSQIEFEWADERFHDFSLNISEKYYSRHGSSQNIQDEDFNGRFEFFVLGLENVHTDQSPQFRLFPRPEGALFTSSKTEFVRQADKFSSKYSSGIRVMNELDAELKTRHYLYIRVQDIQSMQSLVGLCRVNVIDENDQIPVFDSSELRLSLLEGEAQRLRIGQVQAFDQDISYPNNYVRYRFKDAKDSISDLFSVSENGEIVANGKFDRERQSLYSFYIEAYDGANGYGLDEPNTDTVAVRVEIVDVNDNIPKFLVEQVHATISEGLERGSAVVELLCTDPDFDTDLQFSIIAGNEAGHFAVRKKASGWKSNTMLHEAIAEVFVVGRLNHETKSIYRLSVQASDSKNYDNIQVNINLTKFRNKAPVWHFEPNGQNARVSENTTSHRLFRLNATGGEGETMTTYEIVTGVRDQCPGCFRLHENIISLEKGLERDAPGGKNAWIVAVAARSRKASNDWTLEGSQWSSFTYALLNISLIDVNNHAPHIDATFLEGDRFVLMEGEKHASLKFRLNDLDDPTMGHAGPFPIPEIVSINPPECISLRNIKISRYNSPNAFIINHFNVPLDREAKRLRMDRSPVSCKKLLITLRVKDAQGLSGFVKLPITVGDKDDNKHFDGDKHIMLMALKGALEKKRSRPGVYVGDVFVEDQDDWDRNEKTFTPLPTLNALPLSIDTYGRIKWNGLDDAVRFSSEFPAELDEYEFKVDVFDRAIGRSATGFVFISIRYLNEIDIYNAARVRFCRSFTEYASLPIHEHFISKLSNRTYPSLLELFVSNVSAILNVPMNEVNIINIKRVFVPEECMDIYLSVKQMSRLYLEHRLRRRLDLFSVFFSRTPQVGSVDSTICSNTCPSNLFCSMGLVINSLKPHVTNSNRTAFAGINMYYAPFCSCSNYLQIPREQRTCLGTFPQCRNGGKCRDDGVDFFCDCPMGFDGPRCEALVRSFNKNGFVRLPPFQICQPSKLHFEFTSLSESRAGLLMLNLPDNDALAVQLMNGSLQVSVGGVQVNFEGTELVDGHWHHVDIELVGGSARLHLDQCHTRIIRLSEFSSSRKHAAEDGSLYLGGIPERLRVRDVLRDVLHVHEFEGCIRNVIINGDFLDLHLPQSLDKINYRNSEASGRPCPCRHQVICESTVMPRSISPTILPSWIWLIMLTIMTILLITLMIAVVLFVRHSRVKIDPLAGLIPSGMDPHTLVGVVEDDETLMADTIVSYDEEAAGEQDQLQYDLTMLRKSVNKDGSSAMLGTLGKVRKLEPIGGAGTSAENDSVIVYASEGRASICWPGGRVSPLSSLLASSSEDDEDDDTDATTRLLSTAQLPIQDPTRGYQRNNNATSDANM